MNRAADTLNLRPGAPDTPAQAAAPSRRVVAAFDFDGTISTCDSLQKFLAGALGWPRFAGGAVLALPWLLACAMGVGGVDRHQAKERLLRATLGGRRVTQVQQWAADFAGHTLAQWLRPEMLEKLAWHQAQGHRTVLVSASPSLYLAPWARQMGFETALCTELEVRGDRYTGRLASRNCWGPEKVRRLNAWWQDDEPALLYAYGDSRGDQEMLERADFRWFRGVEQPPKEAA